MKTYIQPTIECHEGLMQLHLMMSITDEVGTGGQLANSFDFVEEDEKEEQSQIPDKFDIGF